MRNAAWDVHKVSHFSRGAAKVTYGTVLSHCCKVSTCISTYSEISEITINNDICLHDAIS